MACAVRAKIVFHRQEEAPSGSDFLRHKQDSPRRGYPFLRPHDPRDGPSAAALVEVGNGNHLQVVSRGERSKAAENAPNIASSIPSTRPPFVEPRYALTGSITSFASRRGRYRRSFGFPVELEGQDLDSGRVR